MQIRVLIILFLITANLVRGVIMGGTPVTLDFTAEESAAEHTTWSEWLEVMADGSGLGCELPPNATRDVWIQTRPIGLGMAWRPCRSASFIIDFTPTLEAKPTGSSGYYYPGLGNMFVRHSIDLRTWSNWQAVQFDHQSTQKKNEMRFVGIVATPSSERTDYEKRLREFQRSDVPWIDDEESLMALILEDDPTYLERHTPFIGYVQFRYEFGISSGQRVQTIDILLSWMLGGLHQPPKDPDLRKLKRGPWRFRHPELTTSNDPSVPDSNQ